MMSRIGVRFHNAVRNSNSSELRGCFVTIEPLVINGPLSTLNFWGLSVNWFFWCYNPWFRPNRGRWYCCSRKTDEWRGYHLTWRWWPDATDLGIIWRRSGKAKRYRWGVWKRWQCKRRWRSGWWVGNWRRRSPGIWLLDINKRACIRSTQQCCWSLIWSWAVNFGRVLLKRCCLPPIDRYNRLIIYQRMIIRMGRHGSQINSWYSNRGNMITNIRHCWAEHFWNWVTTTYHKIAYMTPKISTVADFFSIIPERSS